MHELYVRFAKLLIDPQTKPLSISYLLPPKTKLVDRGVAHKLESGVGISKVKAHIKNLG